ncbi:MAG TPA: anthranilate synthase component I family protein, partial [Pirellulaceae bacterium]|nr:anthranilate synthase component I family protein [Pirellulaceae bacterium]
YLELPADAPSPLDELQRRLAPWHATTVRELPPFQGGAAGLFGYDLGRSLERLPTPRFDEFQVPALAIGLYDVVVAWDHAANRAWIISQGFPERDDEARRRRARQRCDALRRRIESATSGVRPAAALQTFSSRQTASGEAASHVASGFASKTVTASQLAPQYAAGEFPGLTSDFSADGYRAAVRRAVEYVEAGDIFQVNLSQRLLYPARDDSRLLYQRLRRRNPAPFAGWFDLGEFQIVSASPERFVQVRDRQVEARPIKGTRRRSWHPEADLFAGDELQASEKDRAENVMIVDLLRNDLSRVCEPASVRVTQLCGLEVYQYVQHLVSVVRGELADGRTSLDLVRASFPGGSITGAPKVRAMEIIAELEPTARGPYCGSLGYLGFDGTLDLSILIRTITAGRGWWQLPVGGGIVAQSDPQREYEETWHKAAGLLRALEP